MVSSPAERRRRPQTYAALLALHGRSPDSRGTPAGDRAEWRVAPAVRSPRPTRASPSTDGARQAAKDALLVSADPLRRRRCRASVTRSDKSVDRGLASWDYDAFAVPVLSHRAVRSGWVRMVSSRGVRGHPRCSQSVATPRSAPATNAAGTSRGVSDGSAAPRSGVSSGAGRRGETRAAAVVRRRTCSMTRALPVGPNRLR
jgi:hypothetical protein